MEIILVVMFQSLLTSIHLPMLPNLLFFLYLYNYICDQVTVVTRRSRVATGLVEKNSLTAKTNSSHCHDIYVQCDDFLLYIPGVYTKFSRQVVRRAIYLTDTEISL